MNILVISDSHGRRERIEEALARQIKKPDAIIFLGDGLRDITSAEIGDIPVYAVSGNCDMGGMFCDNAPTEQCLILGEKKIFFTRMLTYIIYFLLLYFTIGGNLLHTCVQKTAHITVKECKKLHSLIKKRKGVIDI